MMRPHKNYRRYFHLVWRWWEPCLCGVDRGDCNFTICRVWKRRMWPKD